jgi:hypothetical protein
MALAGAALGPFLDSFHSAFGVLQYDQPLTATLWGSVEHPALITTVWVPELFGLAGFLIGWLYILLDNAGLEDTKNASGSTATTTTTTALSPQILLGISISPLLVERFSLPQQRRSVDHIANRIPLGGGRLCGLGSEFCRVLD